MPKRILKRTVPAAGWLAVLACLGGAAPAPAVPGSRRCSATITGSFADACRDFAAHSSKDISYVELHYVGGSVVRDESVNRHDWAIDGGPGDEIDFAKVKSGRTIEEFACEPSNGAPTALLEIQTPPVDQVLGHCYDFSDGLICEQSIPRPAWTSPAQVPDIGGLPGFFQWGCGGFSDPSLCSFTVRFRGTGSSDPNGDIASWSLDFGDGTSASGAWSAPPTEVVHAYPLGRDNCVGVVNGIDNVCVITLTVTDSAGQSDSDTLLMIFLQQSPD
jgi:PKD domain-containing protein